MGHVHQLRRERGHTVQNVPSGAQTIATTAIVTKAIVAARNSRNTTACGKRVMKRGLAQVVWRSSTQGTWSPFEEQAKWHPLGKGNSRFRGAALQRLKRGSPRV